MDKYTKIADNLIKFLLDCNQAPYFKEYTDLQNGKSFGNLMIEDLGDTMPFLYFYGKEHNKEYCKIADKTSKFLITNFQHKCGFFGIANNSFFDFYNFDKMSDLALGVNLMYNLTDDKFYLESSKRFFNALGDFSRKGVVPYLYSNNFNLSFYFSTGKFGLYIEELCNLYNITKEERYLYIAKSFAYFWINNPFFKKNGLFPFVFKPNIFKPLGNVFFRKKFKIVR